jgi:iron complex transport system substrate-binding protein
MNVDKSQSLKRVKKDKSLFIVVWLVVFVGLLVSCRPAVTTDVPGPSRGAMRQVVDDLGRTVTIPVDVKRVVSTAPSVTENIFAAGAGDRLVGVTTFCDYPEEAKSIAKVGDTMNPNMETIIALKPDIVFVSTASQIEAFMKTLESNGTAVYVANPRTVDDVLNNLSDLGVLFGTQQHADTLVADLTRRVAAVRGGVWGGREPRVFVQISKEPLFTIGRGSFLSGVLETARGRSLTADVETAFPKLSKETASALNPEVIILSDSPDNQEPNDAFRNSHAVKDGRVYKINADILSRPGPRLVDALVQIARLLHPEKFKTAAERQN